MTIDFQLLYETACELHQRVAHHLVHDPPHLGSYLAFLLENAHVDVDNLKEVLWVLRRRLAVSMLNLRLVLVVDISDDVRKLLLNVILVLRDERVHVVPERARRLIE